MSLLESSPLLQLRNKGPAPRRGTMFSYTKKGLNLRPDSPKTREACLALGFDPAIFKLRKIDEFGGPDVPENVQKMRYDHYVRKTETAFKEISKVRKQLAKKNKGLQNLQLEQSFHRDESIVNDMIETYNKKMAINKEEDDGDSYESFDENDPVLVLEDQLEKEIRKYKRALAVKAKEVQHQLDNEKRRYQLQMDMEGKERKIAELHEKLRQQKALKKKHHQQAALKKFTDIKNKEKQFNEKQIEERKRQLERFEELGRKLKFDEQMKRKEMEDHEKLQQARFDIVKANKKKFDKDINEKMTHTLTHLQSKQLECSSNKERFTWESKLEKLTMRSTHYDEKLRRIRQLTEQKEAQAIQKVVNKLFTKEHDLEVLDKQKQQHEQSKQKEEMTKRKKVEKQLERIQSLQIQRITDLEKRFQDLEVYSSRRKDDIDYQKNIKKEKMKIKQQDLLENYQRQERLKDLRFKQVIKDNQQLNEQKSLEKLSMELVRKAQQELQRKLKQENEHLDRSLMSVSQADSKMMSSLVVSLEKNIHKLSSIN